MWLGSRLALVRRRESLFFQRLVYHISIYIVNRDTHQTPQPQPALGKAIRELRQEQGASLEGLAPQAGVTPNTLSLIERGEANPTWGTVRGIATALGVSISKLAKQAEKFEP